MVSRSTDQIRVEARAWLQANAQHRSSASAAGESTSSAAIDSARRAQSSLLRAGLAGITWPESYGGQGLSDAELFAFNDEAAEFELPLAPFGIGVDMCGPAILELGTEEQRKRFIPPLLAGEEIWCQLFSEPSAGSDLASLRTRARRDGSGWWISGQKTWTSWAQVADWGLLIARTNSEVPKRQGLTAFLLDMHAPGVTVRPLRDISGSSHFNEVFFDDVRVEGAQVLGEVGQGWNTALVTLRHERINVGARVRSRRAPISYDSLRAMAGSKGLLADPVVQDRLVDVYIGERVSELLIQRISEQARSGIEIGARGSVSKLSSAIAESDTAAAAAELLGAALLGWDEDAELTRMSAGLSIARRASIAGGTNEIQRNIIGERVLGLPRDPYREPDPQVSPAMNASSAGVIS